MDGGRLALSLGSVGEERNHSLGLEARLCRWPQLENQRMGGCFPEEPRRVQKTVAHVYLGYSVWRDWKTVLGGGVEGSGGSPTYKGEFGRHPKDGGESY